MNWKLLGEYELPKKMQILEGGRGKGMWFYNSPATYFCVQVIGPSFANFIAFVLPSFFSNSSHHPFSSCSLFLSWLSIITFVCRGKTGFAIAINLMYGMASLSSTFALLLVTESSIKSKHVQKVSGVYLSNFWFSALLWDLVNFLLPCLLMLVSVISDDDLEALGW